MQIYKENLKAGVAIQLFTRGRVFLIDSISVSGAGVDVTLSVGGAEKYLLPNRKTAFKCIVDFDGVKLVSSVDLTIVFFVSMEDVQIGLADGAGVNIPNGVQVTNSAANPVQVSFAGVVTPVLGNVTVNNTNAQAVPVAQQVGASFDTQVKNNNANAVPVQSQMLTTLTNIAAVAVGIVNTALINDPTLKRLRFRNTHASAMVAIGANGVTLAGAVILLAPGDVYFEEDAAGAAWFAISDTAGANIAMQGAK